MLTSPCRIDEAGTCSCVALFAVQSRVGPSFSIRRRSEKPAVGKVEPVLARALEFVGWHSGLTATGIFNSR